MFLKILVSLFSILVLIKNMSYSKYEYDVNKNVIAAITVCCVSVFSIGVLNIVLFFIKF